jgi:hypothetical protein
VSLAAAPATPLDFTAPGARRRPGSAAAPRAAGGHARAAEARLEPALPRRSGGQVAPQVSGAGRSVSSLSHSHPQELHSSPKEGHWSSKEVSAEPSLQNFSPVASWQSPFVLRQATLSRRRSPLREAESSGEMTLHARVDGTVSPPLAIAVCHRT